MSKQFIAYTNKVDKVWNRFVKYNRIKCIIDLQVSSRFNNVYDTFPINKPIKYTTKRKSRKN